MIKKLHVLRTRAVTDIGIALVIGLLAGIGAWWHLEARGSGYGFANTTAEDFEPAILWASGHGFSRTFVAPPALQNFLSNRTRHLDANALPASMLVRPAAGDRFINDRFYLLYAAGILWRLFGIDWIWLRVLAGMLFGAFAAFVYAIFRLGMGRAFSVAGVLLTVSSPLMIVMLTAIRDLSKAPFIVATIFVTGYLLSRPVRALGLLALSLFFGALIGVGVGFRQDCSICMPPIVFAVLFLAHSEGRRLLPSVRIVAVGLLVSAFVAAAAPVLLMNLEIGGFNGFYLLEGQSLYCQRTMEMRRACYAPLAACDDVFVRANICLYDARAPKTDRGTVGGESTSGSQKAAELLRPIANLISPHSAWNAERLLQDLRIERWRAFENKLFWHSALNASVDPMLGAFQLAGACAMETTAGSVFAGGIMSYSKREEEGARRLLTYLDTTFPADVLSRCYSSTIHIIRGMRGYAATTNTVIVAPHGRGNPDDRIEPVATWRSVHLFIERHLERWGEYYALAALLIISTHSVRVGLGTLGIIMYFCGYVGLFFQDRHAFHLEFVAFWLPAVCLDRALNLARAMAVSETRRSLFSCATSPHWWFQSIRRAASFAVIAFLVFYPPLFAARLWQHGNVSRLLDTYRQCQLEPVSFEGKTDPAGRVYYCPTPIPGLDDKKPIPLLLRLAGVSRDPLDGLLYDYLVAEFEVPRPCPPLIMRIAYNRNAWDSILDLRDDYDEGCGLGPFTVRYFFPVFHYMTLDEANPFRRFSISPEYRLRNLYRVKNQEDFPVPMNLWLFDPQGDFRWHQGIPFFGTWI